MLDVCIIGVGNLGGALAIALSNAGYEVRKFVVRNGRIANRIKRRFLPNTTVIPLRRVDTLNEKLVFIASDDPEIVNISNAIATFMHPGQYVFHTSGSLPSTILDRLRIIGALTASIHPLTSISDPFEGAGHFRDTYFCVEGSSSAVRMGKRIVRSLGGKAFSIDPAMKPLYHAAAVTSAGHVTVLFDAAVEMMSACGVGRKASKKILLPLLESTVSNLKTQDPAKALTGTFARLDLEAFQRHLSSMEVTVPCELISLYLEVGMRSLDLVEKRDGMSTRLTKFRKAISIAKRKTRC